jgi:hypothetical protein
MKEGMDSEALTELEKDLRKMDKIKHPLHELVFDTRKKRPTTAVPEKKPVAYVPPWYRGETANAKIAMNVMKQLPKG